jgi:NAD(P)-dependent dehydrogenase (short-subunit alcohol dehydrogenase family)
MASQQPKDPLPQGSKKNKKKAEVAFEDDEVIPQLEAHQITGKDMRTTIRVLEAVGALQRSKRKDQASAEDGLEEYKHVNLRALRKALAPCLELHKRTMFQGKAEEEHYEQRIADRSLKRQKTTERAMQKQYIASAALRKGRIDKLKTLQDDAADEEAAKMQAFLIPDGHVDAAQGNSNATPLLEDGSAQEEVKFSILRSCYVCKIRFRDRHQFYDQLCPSCATLNWEKRHQTANLTDRVAVVTGARVKIGLQVCLKLLRAGCHVVATTRFPNAAVAAYRREEDFAAWSDRLEVYGLDLRDVTGLEAFTRHLKQKYTKGIDIVVNNACQTIRRPAAYYTPLVEQEQELWEKADETHQKVLEGCREFERIRRRLFLLQKGASTLRLDGAPISAASALTNGDDQKMPAVETSTLAHTNGNSTRDNMEEVEEVTTTPFETEGISHSAAMSQTVLLAEDAGMSDSILPPGMTDVQGQQLDLRSTNSWILKMEEVSTPEIMECMFVNAIAPFVLNSRLKPLMAFPDERPDRYMINVSAMEGKFYRYKMPCHPHTNMAKAALNMLTRTSSEDLAKKHRVFMNSVDTGWINDENPLTKASQTAAANNFQTPIDEVDAAARILDPVFMGVNEQARIYGKFLKDYRESEW